MVPEQAHPRTFWEHVGRYRFAKGFARGRRTLDIACGDGYGASALGRAGASSVIGVDLSAETCELARRKYGLDARVGDARSIPLPDRSVDLVVSFETIEHVDDPAAFLSEAARVLTLDGTLIVSTPNRPVYSPEGTSNPYHQAELDENEFLGLLQARFQTVRIYSQFPRSAAWWSVRSLSSEVSPWLKIKGFWRLTTWLCPELRAELSPEARVRAVDLILEDDRFPSTLFNPYLVRPRSEQSREQPYLLIAVATGFKAG
jgi:ubiquinone/menaquinone biosynthesis C-methylase UbiE